MSHELDGDDFGGMTRREALMAAGAGALSMIGFCSACEAGEVKMASGAATLPKNISRVAPNNPTIQDIQKAARLFRNGHLFDVHLSTDNVVSRVQEFFHRGDAAQKLGRSRSVVRVTAAGIDESDKSRVLSHLSDEGFSRQDLHLAQVFFTRSSLLDHDKISSVKDLSVEEALKLPSLNNTNINTLMAVGFDQSANIFKTCIVLNAGRAIMRISLLIFAVSRD
jgi:hypothetical protein